MTQSMNTSLPSANPCTELEAAQRIIDVLRDVKPLHMSEEETATCSHSRFIVTVTVTQIKDFK